MQQYAQRNTNRKRRKTLPFSRTAIFSSNSFSYGNKQRRDCFTSSVRRANELTPERYFRSNSATKLSSLKSAVITTRRKECELNRGKLYFNSSSGIVRPGPNNTLMKGAGLLIRTQRGRAETTVGQNASNTSCSILVKHQNCSGLTK